MEPQEMTVNDYIAVLKRRKWSLVTPAAIVLLAAILVALLLPAVYISTATILIEEQEIPVEFVMSSVTSYAEQRLQSINQKIMSYSRLNDIIDRFNLYPDLRNKKTREELVDILRDSIKLGQISADIIDPRTGRPGTATIAFTLSYEGETAKVTYQVANLLTSLYLKENLKVREKQALGTSEFIESQLGKIKTDLLKYDAKITRFKERHANELPEFLQVNLQVLQRVELTLERLLEQLRSLKEKQGYLQGQLAGTPAQLALAEKKSRLEELRSQLSFYETRFSAEYPDVSKTRADIAELEKQYAELKASIASSEEEPDNPAYISLASQLATTVREIKSLNKQVRDLEKRAAVYRRRVASTPRVGEEYRNLAIQRDSTQAKYDDLSRKLMESKVAYGLEKDQKGERFTLIDPARMPEKPYKPNRLAIILIGLVLAIGAGVGTAALKEFTDNAVYSVEDLVWATSRPVLASIPEIVTKKDLARKRIKHLSLAVGAVILLVGAVLLFHLYVMDLNVLWAKLSRELGV